MAASTDYTIQVRGVDDSWLFLAPRGDGTYVVKDTLLGAALWKDYDSALMAAHMLGLKEYRVRRLNTIQVNRTAVSEEEAHAVERKLNT